MYSALPTWYMEPSRLRMILEKTIAMIYASEEDQAYRRRKLIKIHGKRKKEKKESISSTDGLKNIPAIPTTIYSKTPICDAIFCRKPLVPSMLKESKVKVKRRQIKPRCVCFNMVDHLLKCKSGGIFRRIDLELAEAA